MKLIRFGNPGEEKPGIALEGKRFDCSDYFEDWNHDFFRNDGLMALQEIIGKRSLKEVPEEERWGSPIARPGTILCIGLNYSDHARESGMDLPKEPVLFMKAANTIGGPFDPVTIPKRSVKTDWEVEMGVVLKRDVLYLEDVAEAEKMIAGYCIVHDISEREFQLNRGGQWVKGKSCPGFSPVGPFLVTRDEIDNVLDLRMILKVNQVVKQSGNTGNMVFNPSYIVWYISQFMKLEAGDLISTGTPHGVGLGMKPPQYLMDGDVVELEIELLGQQKQLFKDY
ncbi:MAG: fumarylacetoacetate hydrolase family protein [Cyclobacteriaceae bacterium]|nr:fumarylacetoacetate hydrolase family protein [Cyclobacteriaceae bacterium]